MTLGTNNKKGMIALTVLGLGAVYGIYSDFFAGPSIPAADRPTASTPASTDADAGPVTMPGVIGKKAPSKGSRMGKRDDAFHPVYLATRVEDRVDPATIDPTLHKELLAKVQSVEPAGGHRNLFVFGATPPPKPAELPKGEEPKIALAKKFVGPIKPADAPPPKKDTGPPAETPLHIELKYYGIVAYTRTGRKTACFMDGDEIMTASEGDTVKRRYKVVRIGPTTVVMEDIDSKRQGTVQIEKEAQQG